MTWFNSTSCLVHTENTVLEHSQEMAHQAFAWTSTEKDPTAPLDNVSIIIKFLPMFVWLYSPGPLAYYIRLSPVLWRPEKQ